MISVLGKGGGGRKSLIPLSVVCHQSIIKSCELKKIKITNQTLYHLRVCVCVCVVFKLVLSKIDCIHCCYILKF